MVILEVFAAHNFEYASFVVHAIHTMLMTFRPRPCKYPRAFTANRFDEGSGDSSSDANGHGDGHSVKGRRSPGGKGERGKGHHKWQGDASESEASRGFDPMQRGAGSDDGGDWGKGAGDAGSIGGASSQVSASEAGDGGASSAAGDGVGAGDEDLVADFRCAHGRLHFISADCTAYAL